MVSVWFIKNWIKSFTKFPSVTFWWKTSQPTLVSDEKEEPDQVIFRCPCVFDLICSGQVTFLLDDLNLLLLLVVVVVDSVAEAAVNCIPLLRCVGFPSDVRLVTSEYHMPRALALFQQV